ncbi:MAG TPA: aminotransferase class III-fold pyridoxal phosphate-dependent enzyme [Gemmatimonadales bacterium]|jgi:adenosylmethionine-8-amino-7-oxononanoate aminotransferase|nr:aminotransferase class III-fold pyridoxal phosphate-dependent enzyme [Gemmatimonadales bacterium]
MDRREDGQSGHEGNVGREEREGPRKGTEHQLSGQLEEQPRAEEFLPPSRPAAEPPREALIEWDDAHCWHPFTQQGSYRESDPLLIVSGDGHYLVDINGRRYLDGVSSRWCNLLGHSRPEIDEAIREQLIRIAHSTFHGHANVPAVTLAHRLAERAPDGLTRVFFTDDGSTAVRSALQMAGEFWRQSTDAADHVRTDFLGLMGASHTMMPHADSTLIQAGSPAQFLELLEREGHRLAAAVLEPGVQVAAGARVQPVGFVAEVREAASRAGTFFIADETAIGFGRSGAMFACDKEGIAPDLLCLSNGLTGGYLPMGVTLATERIHDRFVDRRDEGRLFAHGYTFSGNQLASSAALATLDVFDRTGLLDRLPGRVEHLETALEQLRDLPGVAEVRQYGLVAGIELEPDGRAQPAHARAREVCQLARSRGVFVLPVESVVMVVPPLTVTQPELDMLVDAVAASCEELAGVTS